MSKAALITGGAVRIGRELALRLAYMSYDIALHFNSSESRAQETAERVRDCGVRCSIFNCDLACEEDVLSLIPRVVEKFPALEVLVNNASVFEKGSILETGPQFFSRQMAVNFKAPFFLSRDFARSCKKGLIINVLDTRISRNDFSYAAYTLSRKALAELTGISAREFAPGIRVNAIAPGLVLPPEGESEGCLDRLAMKIPLRRTGDIDNITHALEFLVKNDFITGQVIYVDGGEHLM
ncbi:MAG: SDR family oxidoreductase [Gemmatimonadota bacterium]|nr:SDR family oxidoreductase [Gemmatimonadota bacterium]